MAGLPVCILQNGSFPSLVVHYMHMPLQTAPSPRREHALYRGLSLAGPPWKMGLRGANDSWVTVYIFCRYVMDVYMPRDRVNRAEHRGFGFVTFETEAAIIRVASYGGHMIRWVCVCVCVCSSRCGLHHIFTSCTTAYAVISAQH